MTMTVQELRNLLSKCDQEERISAAFMLQSALDTERDVTAEDPNTPLYTPEEKVQFMDLLDKRLPMLLADAKLAVLEEVLGV